MREISIPSIRTAPPAGSMRRKRARVIELLPAPRNSHEEQTSIKNSEKEQTRTECFDEGEGHTSAPANANFLRGIDIEREVIKNEFEPLTIPRFVTIELDLPGLWPIGRRTVWHAPRSFTRNFGKFFDSLDRNRICLQLSDHF